MAIQVRRGNEADFDANKMLPGEWAVSLDTKYVRMCFSPGIVLRMATYEAFEEDMEQIETILSECRTIKEVVEQIQQNITDAELVIEDYVLQAKEYSEIASNEADRAKEEADRAASVSGVDVATTEIAGIVKPDGDTISVDADGTIHSIGGGVSDYEKLENKPLIGGVELSGDKSLAELGAAPIISGTTAEIEAMISAGEIPEGAIVNITDDDEENTLQSQINALSNLIEKNKIKTKLITATIDLEAGETKAIGVSSELSGFTLLNASVQAGHSQVISSLRNITLGLCNVVVHNFSDTELTGVNVSVTWNYYG